MGNGKSSSAGGTGGTGAGGGTGGFGGLMGAFTGAGGGMGARSGQIGSQISLAPFQTVGDYDGGGNPDLIKYQGQSDDKTANFLAGTDKGTDLAKAQQQTNDPYPFYDNPMQKLVMRMGLNAPPTVLSEADFRKYVAQTGATVLWRGWSGQNAVDRFKQSPNSHIGNGINGDGYYLAPSKSTARNYGGTGTKMALSPQARVVSLDKVNAEIAKASPKLQRSLRKAGGYGAGGTRTYGSNDGQAQMALKMGYNVIDAGWAVIPLTRDAVVISDKNAW